MVVVAVWLSDGGELRREEGLSGVAPSMPMVELPAAAAATAAAAVADGGVEAGFTPLPLPLPLLLLVLLVLASPRAGVGDSSGCMSGIMEHMKSCCCGCGCGCGCGAAAAAAGGEGRLRVAQRVHCSLRSSPDPRTHKRSQVCRAGGAAGVGGGGMSALVLLLLVRVAVAEAKDAAAGGFDMIFCIMRNTCLISLACAIWKMFLERSDVRVCPSRRSAALFASVT